MASYSAYIPALDGPYVDKITNFINAVETDMTAVEAEITTARNGEVDLNTRLDAQDTATSAVQSEVTTARDGEANLNARLDASDVRVTALEVADANELFTDLTDVQGTFVGSEDYYLRINSGGTQILYVDVAPGSGLADSPMNGATYGRNNGTWAHVGTDIFNLINGIT